MQVLEETAGLPLGLLPDTEYASQVFQLEPGDSMLAYTDGLVEAMSPARQMYGAEKLQRSAAPEVPPTRRPCSIA